MKSLHVIQCWFYLRDKEPWMDFRCFWIHIVASSESSWVIHGTLALFRNDNFTIPPCTGLVWCLIQFKPAHYSILVDKDETEARALPSSPLSHIFGDAAVGQVWRKAMETRQGGDKITKVTGWVDGCCGEIHYGICSGDCCKPQKPYPPEDSPRSALRLIQAHGAGVHATLRFLFPEMLKSSGKLQASIISSCHVTKWSRLGWEHAQLSAIV